MTDVKVMDGDDAESAGVCEPLAHKRLDEAVLDAYGWAHDPSDEEILARLLKLNLARAKAS